MRQSITFYQVGEVEIFDFEDLIRAWIYNLGASTVINNVGDQKKMLIISDSEEFH